MTVEATIRWQTAIHEAGHAVVGRAVGIVCGDVTIEPDDDFDGYSITGDVWDTVSQWERAGKYRDARSACIGRILTLMAGAEAVNEIAGGVEDHGDEDDRRQINFMLGDAGGLSETRLRAACRQLVRRHRNGIESLAFELLARGSIAGNEVETLIADKRKQIHQLRYLSPK